eukprot:TRINITY_DN7331_c0_g1_i1.p1 TRINITY_DN7331_c0_g1~~TRINITY_DN7331_c0_g1_i1.p1  ORF type:complete len:279 (-),score=41.59 TRINITY_DN7331_c0_g1_i1:137-973(-)
MVNLQKGSIQNTVYYCCVSKGNRVLYSYSNEDHEIENVAALCLERTPSYHIYYFHTARRRIFGFLMEDGCVYFAIADEGLGNSGVLRFLQHVKDGFKKAFKHGSLGSLVGLSSACLQEELVHVIRRLVSSLENVSRADDDRAAERSLHHPGSMQVGSSDGQIDAVVMSTEAPLLCRPSKHEKKKKMKDRVVESRDIILEEPTDSGIRIDIDTETNQGGGVSGISLQKSSSSVRTRGQLPARRSWWHRVRVVLAVDAVVLLVLLAIWLGICKGFQCMSH